MTNRFLIALSILAGLLPLNLMGQLKPLAPPQGLTRAVIVGVSEYNNERIPRLQFAHIDADAFARFLRSEAGGNIPENQIKLLTNKQATQGQMAAALTWLLEESKEGDTAIIFFSGHGDMETQTVMNHGFLLTHDAPASTYMAGGAFPVFYLQFIVQTLSTQRKAQVVLITDACHAGMIIGVNSRLLLNQHMEGIPRYIYETTKQMALTHPEDKFILFFDRKIETDFKFPLNVSSVVVPWHARHPVLWYWWFEVILPLYLRWKKVDVFYSGDGYLSKRSHVPTVMVMHDLAYLHYPQQIAASTLAYYKKNVPQFLSKADIVVAVSKYVKQDIVAQIGIPESKVLVAYNAVSIPWQTNWGSSSYLK